MLDCQKHLFSLPDDIHYLNCAYMSPLLKRVEVAGMEGLIKKRLPHKVSGVEFFDIPNRTRELFARLINAPDKNCISIIPSVSYGMGIVAKNLRAEKGQNIVSVAEEFPSNVYAWKQHIANGVELRLVKGEHGEHRTANWNNSILEAIDENTALVVLSSIHWADGTVFDLEQISSAAKKVGALFVVDGTQSLGAMPFDVQQIKPDALIAASYKCMMGVYSIGYAYWGGYFSNAEPLEETWIGRKGSEDFRKLVDYEKEYQAGMSRLNVGEVANFALIPAANAALEQLLEWQSEQVQKYCGGLNTLLERRLKDSAFIMPHKNSCAEHLFGISLPTSINVESLQTALIQANVFVSLRGDFIRVAPSVYNTEQDINAFADVLLSLK